MIAIPYKCYCMKESRIVEVPARREDESIIDWLGLCVQPALYLDHRKHNALCLSPAMEWAKLPADGDFIGQQQTLN